MKTPLFDLLSHLKIVIPRRIFDRLIFSHPEYPNMLSIVDTLERLGISYTAFRVNKNNLSEIEFPFLLFLNGKRGKKVVLIRNDKDLDQNNVEIEDWNDVVLQIERAERVKNKEIQKSISKEKTFQLQLKLLIFISFSLLITVNIFLFSTSNGVFVLSSLFGFILGCLLISKEFGNTSDFVESFCQIGKKSNCDKILNSKESLIFGAINFSDIVIIFFSFQLLVFCFSAVLPNGFATFYLLFVFISLATIPVILFSLYFQYFRAKVWCPLCLAVDIVLIIQGVVLVNIFYYQDIQIRYEEILYSVIALFILGIIGLSFLLVKNRIGEVNQLNKDLILSHRIKHSLPVFRNLLLHQRKIDSTFFDKEILMGNPDAPIKIVIASNLYCNPCKEQHPKIVQLVNMYPDKVAVAIRFVPNRQNSNRSTSTNGYIIHYWLHTIYNQSGESSHTEKLLENWYKVMDLEKFITENSLEMNEMNNESKVIEEQHYKWQEAVGISYTPSFFINGYEMPSNYSIEDMMVLIPGLADYFSRINESGIVLQEA